jgi:small subunit ribosomal protein S6
VFLVHPDQSEQVPAMLQRYRTMIEGAGGTVHREEDWGRRQLAHSVQKLHKAHYLMLNVECDKATLDELIGAFRFSDAVLRHLVIRRDQAITEPSIMAKAHEEEKEREAQSAARDGRSRDRPVAEPSPKRTDDDGGEDEGEVDEDADVSGEPEAAEDADASGEPEAAEDADASAEAKAAEDQ